ncbi:hypothetical protein PAMP_007934 [Pampus punctatissimus]
MQKIKSLMARQGLKSPQESMADLSPVENLRIPSKVYQESHTTKVKFNVAPGCKCCSLDVAVGYNCVLNVPESGSVKPLEELRELREQPIDPQAEQEMIDSIEEVYFSNDSFDMVQHELEKLPPELNLQELEEYRDKLKRQQAAVSKKVADLILEKQPAYVKELERVTALQTNLQLAAVICTNARRQLSVSKEGFTEASLGLLANQRRRQLLTGLLKSLRTIKTLEEDYPGAIQLCLECQKAASTFKHYSCISELHSKLQDTLEQIEAVCRKATSQSTELSNFSIDENTVKRRYLLSRHDQVQWEYREQLDVALSKTCKHFDVAHYTKVQLAYTLLGKTQVSDRYGPAAYAFHPGHPQHCVPSGVGICGAVCWQR